MDAEVASSVHAEVVFLVDAEVASFVVDEGGSLVVDVVDLIWSFAVCSQLIDAVCSLEVAVIGLDEDAEAFSFVELEVASLLEAQAKSSEKRI